ncbi:MAG: C-GCAxxG-C-C family protein [Candidatus Micrarchaeota archaeon]|nr:C-GCAxxG-C-C family protein [Candidatus Micrarchaeota archaeon]
MGTKPEPSILKACSAFGGGIGRSGSVCGALIGAELALSRYTGTTGTDDKESAAYKKAALLLSKFKKRFGAVDCSKLNNGDFSSEAHRERCMGFIRFSALAKNEQEISFRQVARYNARSSTASAKRWREISLQFD